MALAYRRGMRSSKKKPTSERTWCLLFYRLPDIGWTWVGLEIKHHPKPNTVSQLCTHRPASQPSEGQSLGVWVGMSLLTFKDQNVLIVHCTRPLPEGGTRKNSAER